MNNSRTKNTIINFGTGIFSQILNIVLSFIVRTIFIRTLSSEYLGINGLFTNILTILSFAELGIGNAIIYNMYKPVSENNHEKIKSLMKLYCISYRIIGIVVAIAGLCVIPFMDIIIKDIPNIDENLIIIYLLFLLNTVLSYFFTYKKSIISAYQKENIINNYRMYFYIIKSILQVLLLIIFKNFIIFLLIQVLCTFIENLVISYKANKMFPYLKEKNIKNIDIEESKSIFSNIKSLVMYKLGSVILNGTDNIVISSMIGIEIIGICSNYTMIISSVVGVLGTALNSITSSIGNLNTIEDSQKKEDVFYQILFVTAWLYNFCSNAILILITPFIELWIGSDYVLIDTAIVALALHMYVNGVQFAGYTYRITLGLFERGKYAPIIAAILNIILSIILGKYIGITGIFLATSISRLCTTTWLDAYLVHKYEFKTSVFKFFRKYIMYFVIFIINYIVCNYISSLIGNSGLINFILKALVILIIPNIVMMITFYNSKEFKSIKNRLLNIMRDLKKSSNLSCN